MSLTPQQSTALKNFIMLGQMSAVRLSAVMQIEKALARNLIAQLEARGLLTDYKNSQYGVSAAGRAEMLGLKAKEPEDQQRQIRRSVKRMAAAEAEAVSCELVPVEAEIVELPAPEQADFDTLVRQGLARLNQRLGMKPVKIDNLRLKIETLTSLAESAGQVDKPVQDILFAIANDLHLFADRTS